MGPCSVAQCIGCLMDQPLSCSAADAGMWERGGMVMASSSMCDSAVLPCFHGCLAFLHRHFPPESCPSHPLDPSLHSQQQPSPWDCSTVPKLHLSAATPSWGPAFLSRVCMTAARTVWFSFYLGCHRSAVSPSLKCFFSDSDSCPNVGIGPLLLFSHQLRAGPVLLRLLFFPLVPSSYGALCGSCILFHWSGTPFDSEMMFCKHFCVWRCIPDVSMKRDIFHIYLLLHHLVLPYGPFLNPVLFPFTFQFHLINESLRILYVALKDFKIYYSKKNLRFLKITCITQNQSTKDKLPQFYNSRLL